MVDLPSRPIVTTSSDLASSSQCVIKLKRASELGPSETSSAGGVPRRAPSTAVRIVWWMSFRHLPLGKDQQRPARTTSFAPINGGVLRLTPKHPLRICVAAAGFQYPRHRGCSNARCCAQVLHARNVSAEPVRICVDDSAD